MYGLTDDELKRLKRYHKNRKCYECPHRFVTVYEDDTPAGHTPYHYWVGSCGLLGVEICSYKSRPKECPLKAKA